MTTHSTILSCAVTGSHTTKAHNPNTPITPEEIALAVIDAAHAGAAIAHIHVRDPETEKASMELAYYKEVVDRIRASDTDVLINLTTGPGGRYIPDEVAPWKAAPGSSLTTPERRTEHVVELKPDICSLDLNTMWSGRSAVINSPRNIRVMAERIRAAGVKPELEVFDTGDIHLARDLMDDGTLEGPALFQIVCGIKYGIAATPEALVYAKSILPDGSQWAAFGVGRMAYPMLAQAWLLGGHVRIGMEDATYLEKGVPTTGNAAMVEKAARMIRDLGGRLATVDEARGILGLPSRT